MPWQLKSYIEAMQERGAGLRVEAGQVVFFDSATVHWSPPNRSDQLRVAVNSFVKPSAAPLLHFFADERTSPGTVEAYEIDVRFLDERIMERPIARHHGLGEVAQVRIDWDPDTFVQLCDRGVDEALRPRDPDDGAVMLDSVCARYCGTQDSRPSCWRRATSACRCSRTRTRWRRCPRSSTACDPTTPSSRTAPV